MAPGRGRPSWPVGRPALALAVLAAAVLAAGAGAGVAAPGKPPKCEERWLAQPLDHFRFEHDASRTFLQRYFVCDETFAPGGPVFFYAGNEADVEAYLKATGLVFENAGAFGALVVFAEHRYYGKTQPFGPESFKHDPRFLSSDQALADYAALLCRVRSDTPGAELSPVVAFGGSYGGMLAAWMRVKYPGLVVGAVAASAPVLAFDGLDDPFDPARFWEVVTRDATPAAGAGAACAPNVRAGIRDVFELGKDAAGRGELAEAFRLCKPLGGEVEVETLAYWIQGAFDSLGVGNYPWPSDYIGGTPEHPLPAYPMRAACAHLSDAALTGTQRLAALREAVAVVYNATHDQQCFSLEQTGPAAGSDGSNPWDWQWCTMLLPQELPYFPANGVTDMFWPQTFSHDDVLRHCNTTWGVTPRRYWVAENYGGKAALQSAGNIVLSLGELDPWSSGQVQEDLSESVVVVRIKDGAHHLDLMYSHPDDPESVIEARKVELQHIRKWVAENTPAAPGCTR